MEPAIQVSAVTENEMASIRQVFERAANAIVQASELSKQMQELNSQFAQLKSNLEYSQSHNRELDTLLADTRGQRDRAQSELNETRHHLSEKAHEANAAGVERDQLKITLADIREQLGAMQKERDDYAYKALETSEALEVSNAKFAKVVEALGLGAPQPKPEMPKAENADSAIKASTTEVDPKYHPGEIQFIDAANKPKDAEEKDAGPYWDVATQSYKRTYLPSAPMASAVGANCP